MSTRSANDRAVLLQLARAHRMQLHPAAVKSIVKFLERYDTADHGEVVTQLLTVADCGANRLLDAAAAEVAMQRVADPTMAGGGPGGAMSGPLVQVVHEAPTLIVDALHGTVNPRTGPPPAASVVSTSVATPKAPPARHTLSDIRRQAVALAHLRESAHTSLTRLLALEGQPVGSTQRIVGFLRGFAAKPSSPNDNNSHGAEDAQQPSVVVTLEDADAAVDVALASANAVGLPPGIISKNTVVVATGTWTGKRLDGASLRVPTAVARSWTDAQLGARNFFGGKPSTQSCDTAAVCIFSDVRIDAANPRGFDTLRSVLSTLEGQAEQLDLNALVVVLCGTFRAPTEVADPSVLDVSPSRPIAAAFAALGQAIASSAPRVCAAATFVVVPGPGDLTADCGNGLPSRRLSASVTKGLTNAVPKAHFAGNPCRLRVGDKELLIVRGELLKRFQRDAMVEADPARPEFEHLVATVAGQGCLFPMHDTTNAVDAARLGCFPLPHYVCLADSTPLWEADVHGTKFFNPGSFNVNHTFAWCNVSEGDVEINSAS